LALAESHPGSLGKNPDMGSNGQKSGLSNEVIWGTRDTSRKAGTEQVDWEQRKWMKGVEAGEPKGINGLW